MRTKHWLWIGVSVLLLPWAAACEGNPTAPGLLGPQDTSFEAIVTDPAVTSATLEEAGISTTAVPDEARQLLEQARQKFAEAREAYRSGDRERAAALAEEGRLLVAQALLLVRGEEAYTALAHRLDLVIAWFEERVEGDVEPPILTRLRELQAEAQAAWAAGDAVLAVERLLLALHIADHVRARHHVDFLAEARLSVAMGASSIVLAQEMIGDTPSEVQGRILHRAVELERYARLALQAGDLRKAFFLGRHVVELTFVAVLNAEFPDATDVEALKSLAARVIEAAEAAIGENPTEAQARMLGQAKGWEARGLEIAPASPLRGAALLWRAAVLAHLLL